MENAFVFGYFLSIANNLGGNSYSSSGSKMLSGTIQFIMIKRKAPSNLENDPPINQYSWVRVCVCGNGSASSRASFLLSHLRTALSPCAACRCIAPPRAVLVCRVSTNGRYFLQPPGQPPRLWPHHTHTVIITCITPILLGLPVFFFDFPPAFTSILYNILKSQPTSKSFDILISCRPPSGLPFHPREMSRLLSSVVLKVDIENFFTWIIIVLLEFCKIKIAMSKIFFGLKSRHNMIEKFLNLHLSFTPGHFNIPLREVPGDHPEGIRGWVLIHHFPLAESLQRPCENTSLLYLFVGQSFAGKHSGGIYSERWYINSRESLFFVYGLCVIFISTLLHHCSLMRSDFHQSPAILTRSPIHTYSPPLCSFLSVLFFPSLSHILFSVLSSSHSTALCLPNMKLRQRIATDDQHPKSWPTLSPSALPRRFVDVRSCNLGDTLPGHAMQRCIQSNWKGGGAISSLWPQLRK